MGQKVVLLGLVEVVNLVNEKNGGLAHALKLFRLLDYFFKSLTPEVTAEKLMETALADLAIS